MAAVPLQYTHRHTHLHNRYIIRTLKMLNLLLSISLKGICLTPHKNTLNYYSSPLTFEGGENGANYSVWEHCLCLLGMRLGWDHKSTPISFTCSFWTFEINHCITSHTCNFILNSDEWFERIKKTGNAMLSTKLIKWMSNEHGWCWRTTVPNYDYM